MKTKFRTAWLKIGAFVASAAFVIAVNSVGNTCIFMSYQPDVPSELQQ